MIAVDTNILVHAHREELRRALVPGEHPALLAEDREFARFRGFRTRRLAG